MTSNPAKTQFAPAGRSKDDELEAEIVRVSTSTLISSLMNLMSGLLLVLNEHRQIVALNESFMRMLRIDDPAQALGIRPGEVIECIYADLGPDGCGTSEFCSSCGAAIAIVSSLATDAPTERKCAITVELDGKKSDLYFNVRAVPVTLTDQRFVLLFLHDISSEQRWAVLEHVFFHDINNVVHGLIGKSELLFEETKEELARELHDLSLRLAREIGVQRCLLYSGVSNYKPIFAKVPVSEIFRELELQFSADIVASKRTLVFAESSRDVEVSTDISLVTRVLGNMLKNAIEASQEGDEVKLTVKSGRGMIAFCVWNKQVIPSGVSRRIFQRNFTTKEGLGRGLGTYSMKLFGEDLLGGMVDFTSSEGIGTRFRLRLRI